MFKRKEGGGVKGLLNNVKKNCTFLKGWLPLGVIGPALNAGINDIEHIRNFSGHWSGWQRLVILFFMLSMFLFLTCII